MAPIVNNDVKRTIAHRNVSQPSGIRLVALQNLDSVFRQTGLVMQVDSHNSGIWKIPLPHAEGSPATCEVRISPNTDLQNPERLPSPILEIPLIMLCIKISSPLVGAIDASQKAKIRRSSDR